MKGDATLLKVTKIESSAEKPMVKPSKQDVTKMLPQQTTPRKGGGCDIRSYMTSKSPYRPDCKSTTPVKFFRTEVAAARENETTPAKPAGSIMKTQVSPESDELVISGLYLPTYLLE